MGLLDFFRRRPDEPEIDITDPGLLTDDDLMRNRMRIEREASALRSQREAVSAKIEQLKEQARDLTSRINEIEAPIVPIASELTRRQKKLAMRRNAARAKGAAE